MLWSWSPSSHSLLLSVYPFHLLSLLWSSFPGLSYLLRLSIGFSEGESSVFQLPKTALTGVPGGRNLVPTTRRPTPTGGHQVEG